ncbi:hypothetical protein BUY41_02450 [Staphylococcus cohnii]|nr:hypothetical protein BUY41_02450 [Staphylococcus cohnii]PTF43205.1 hypothetical protein BUY29_03040 [Staphylococcus cohnii]
MVKIKQKKTMNLPQLIEWAYHQGSDVRDEKIKSESMTITFSEIGTPHIETKFHFLQVDELFTVEVEEEITEDTKFKHLIEIEQDDTCYMWLNTSVSAEKQVNNCKNLSKEFHAYIDGEFKLIWTREKGLVE